MYVQGPGDSKSSLDDNAAPVFFDQNAAAERSRNTVNEQEQQGTLPEDTQKRQFPRSINKPKSQKSFQQRITGVFKGGGRTKSPIIAIFLLLFGGGGAMSAFFAPGIIMFHGNEVLVKDLNSELAAVTRTSDQLWKTKLGTVSGGLCRTIKVCRGFQTVNIKQTERNFKRAKIDLEFDRSAGWGAGRGKITKMSYTDQFGKKITITNPTELKNAMNNSTDFRKAMFTAYNPKFAGLKDRPTISFLKKMKTSYSKKLTGNSEKELDKNVTDAVDGKTTIDFTRFRPEKDKDGNDTGRYIDKDGKIYSAEEAKGLDVTEQRIKNAPTSRKLINGLAKGVLITSMIDSACTVYNVSRAVAVAAKTIRQRELIRYAMVFHNTTDAMRAGDATPEQVEYLGKKLTEPDMRQTIVDETKWTGSGTADNPPIAANPDYKKSGLDAEFYKMSAYQDTPHVSTREVQFMAGGGGLVGTLGTINTAVAKALGTDSPSELHDRCKIVQNPVVRGGSLVIGIIAGLGSFGWSTAFGITSSLAFAFALPYLTSMLADIVAGRVTGPDLQGVDMMNAVSVGTSSMLNGTAREHGLMPLSPDQMAEYQNTNRNVQVAYEQVEKMEAKSTPFDVANQYSFVGALARTFAPITVNATTNGVAMLGSITSTLGVAVGSLNVTSSAMIKQKVTADRYEMCPDQTYKEMGVATDPTCVLLFGLPKEAMDIDPIAVTEWMATHNEIDIDSEDGTAKDNKKDWNYKKYLENCVEQQPGAHENTDEDDNNGTECSEKKYFNANWHYAKYKLVTEVSKSQDGELPGVDGGSANNFDSSDKGDVSPSGWAYPTTSDASITSPFGPRGGTQHRGDDLVPQNGAVGKPIFAARDGKVIAAGPASGFGNWIVIQHDIDGKRYDTVYGHMFNDGVLVKVGDEVKAGQQIGKIGYNGEVSPPGPDGAHLHFEIWEGGHNNFVQGGKAIDPAPFLREAKEKSITNSNEVRL